MMLRNLYLEIQGDFNGWNGLDHVISKKIGAKEYTKVHESCRLILLPKVSFTDVELTIGTRWVNDFEIKLYNRQDFQWKLLPQPSSKSMSEFNFPEWYVSGVEENKDDSLFTEEEILQLFGMNPGSPDLNTLSDKDTENSNSISEDEDKPDQQASTHGEELRRSSRNNQVPLHTHRNVFDTTLEGMVVLTSLAMAYFQSDNVVERKMAYDKGVVIDKPDIVAKSDVDKVCRIHEDHAEGYARYEALLVEDALPVLRYVDKIIEECRRDGWPTSLGVINLTKICRLFLPIETCNYPDEVSKSLRCIPLGNRWTEDNIEVRMRLRLPYENYEFQYKGEPKYFHVASMPIYKFHGFMKTQIPIPDNLVMEELADGGCKIFNRCQQSRKSQSLWECQTENNIPGELSQCIISTFHGKSSGCPG